MAYFQHHPDNFINIYDDIINIQLSLSDFQVLEPAYILEPPYISQYYEQGVRWSKNTNSDEKLFPIPWVNGDNYISKIQFYIDSLPIIPPTLEEEKAIKISSLSGLLGTKSLGGVDYGALGVVFPSIPYSANALISYKDAGNVPIGFTIQNSTNDQVAVTLVNLLEINDGITELHYLNRLNFESHRDAINLLPTVQDVKDYDITTGWQATPYPI